MIRLTIQRKVFLATFALAAAMAALLLGLTRWHLEQGFGHYVVETELAHLDWLVGNLQTAYGQQQNWAFLQQGDEPWDRNTERAARHLQPRPREEDRPPHLGPHPDPQRGGRPGDLLDIRPRLSVRDQDGTVLAGQPRPHGVGGQRPIQYQGQTVGWLMLEAPKSEAARDAAFLSTQKRSLLLSGLGALVLSLIAAWLLSRQFLKPIRDLAQGARQIANGRFGQRIAVEQDDELGELARDFNAMAEMLARTEEFRRQWVSDSSHELRTPIAVLRAEIEALQDGVRVADDKTLARLLKHVMQMSKMVDDLRQTLDRDNPTTDLELGRLDPIALLHETLEEFKPRLDRSQLELDTSDLLPGSGCVLADANRLQQVFANLIENTLRYTHPGGRLKVSAYVRDGRWLMQFDDSAPAPAAEAMPRLFERFFRAEPSRSREHGGSGLGLAICKTIIEAHHGTIRAKKSALGGLSIRIDLPLEH